MSEVTLCRENRDFLDTIMVCATSGQMSSRLLFEAIFEIITLKTVHAG